LRAYKLDFGGIKYRNRRTDLPEFFEFKSVDVSTLENLKRSWR